MRIKLLPTLVFIVFIFACSKETAESRHHSKELSPLGKKLVGKWKLLNINPAPGDFWEFKDAIIDSLSNDSVTYRVYVDSVKQSACSRVGRWYEKDSVIYGTCVPNAKIVKLTTDTLFFRYYAYGVYLEYQWKRIH